MPTLSVTIEYERGTVVVHPHGEVDYDSAPVLIGAVEEVEGEWYGMVVDLSRVPFMDSAGLHALIALERRCRERGSRLTVTGIQEQPARLLDLVSLGGFFATTA
ncbi:STAS domain-containing protein [Streptomyces atacamensis]|jgi:anti-sigma B factor antagonist|uniref:STAS domain-containing protein n=1 Tax=Streptomyces atacamensis TaxID=531966 RepID=UPI00399CEF12